jgi:hypothetical protein
MENRRVVIDTNWYISASINQRSRRRLYSLLLRADLTIFYCDELVAEYRRVINRPKFKKYIRAHQYNRFLRLILLRLHLVTLQQPFPNLSRDPNDNYLLALSAEAEAEYLVTGDPDLLVLQSVGTTRIVTMAQFLEILA